MNIVELYREDLNLKKIKKMRKVYFPIIVILGITFFIIMLYLLINSNLIVFLFIFLFFADLIVEPIISSIYSKKYNILYNNIKESILQTIGITELKYTKKIDDFVYVKSKQSAFSYTDIKYFKENTNNLDIAFEILKNKKNYADKLKNFLESNKYKNLSMYSLFEKKIKENLQLTNYFYLVVKYVSPSGKSRYENTILISKNRLENLQFDKSLLMSKSDYNKYLKNQNKELLDKKQCSYFEKVNHIIDCVSNNKNIVVIKNDIDELDRLIANLVDRSINSINKIKSIDSAEWELLDKYIDNIESNVDIIIKKNKEILEYYDSEDFNKIKHACENLMNSQREFNEYIDEKVKSIASLFGTRITRDETINEDVYNYIHPYKKSINPFVAELSSNVFASAENNPLDYVVKYFYPDKSKYLEQIQKLHILIEELETLKDAKQIIDIQKRSIQEYLIEVPTYVMKNDEEGFYSRLGFAALDENALTIEYKFSYTSNGGNAKRSFTIPMTEETIIELIKTLESKLTISSFTKEQRSLMTRKLRIEIIQRDNYTCKICGNSTKIEPNLLLEIDHVIPVSKGGTTVESNLQTLCWKCNRQKGSKLL